MIKTFRYKVIMKFLWGIEFESEEQFHDLYLKVK